MTGRQEKQMLYPQATTPQNQKQDARSHRRRVRQVPQRPPPRAFHLFPKLPAELRIRIWTMTLPPSRIVSIRCGSNCISSMDSVPSSPCSSAPASPISLDSFTSSFSGSSTSSRGGCISTARIPVALHVCRESRAEAQRAYSPSFGMARGPGQVYFDFGRDVLYFGARDGLMAADSQFTTAMALCDQQDLARVERVALNDALFWVGDAYDPPSASALTARAIRELRDRLPALRELFFVPREQNPVYADDAVLVHPPVMPMRLFRQVQSAMLAVAADGRDWWPPSWRIMALGSAGTADDPTPAVAAGQHERQTSGYCGPGTQDLEELVMQRFQSYVASY